MLRLSAAVLAVILVGSASAAATTGGPVGFDQAFVGRVNGSFNRATIAMACFGPVYPGETAHPMPGQTLEVLSPLPPTAVGPIHPGNTGSSATRIVAVLRGDPPVVLARFTDYFQTKAIPTSAELPCGGATVVRFVPKPASATSKPAWVTVSFAGQP
ncbi:MAG: hypothetical protein ACRDH7_06785 [Actinomycetota bacterium]